MTSPLARRFFLSRCFRLCGPNRDGGYVLSRGHTPEDYASTIYEKFGINRDKPLFTENNRPVYLGHAGEPLAELF